MSQYAEDLKSSQGSWKMCTVCGFAVRSTNGGTKKMNDHFKREHSDLKAKRGRKAIQEVSQ